MAPRESDRWSQRDPANLPSSRTRRFLDQGYEAKEFRERVFTTLAVLLVFVVTVLAFAFSFRGKT